MSDDELSEDDVGSKITLKLKDTVESEIEVMVLIHENVRLHESLLRKSVCLNLTFVMRKYSHYLNFNHIVTKFIYTLYIA